VNQRISRWLLLGCAIVLGACNADTTVMGPTAVRVPAQTAVTPSRSIVQAAPQANNDVPAQKKPRGRYAMAAN
jgi:hypothetical protein